MGLTAPISAAVWLAPMVPKLPLPLAQRVQRLLDTESAAEAEAHVLGLCEAIVAYEACMRASVAAAVVPAGHRAALARGVGEFRRVLERREATIADYADLLFAAADAIEQLEPGHPLGRTELERPRPAWVARPKLVEALGDELDPRLAAKVMDGGIAGIIAVWADLVAAQRDTPSPADAHAWLDPLADLIVDTLNSSALGEASLSHVERGEEPRLLHGLEAELDPTPADAGAYELGAVCWRFDARVIPACGLLVFWRDEHELEHVGIVRTQTGAAEYFDFGADRWAPESATGKVVWTELRGGEAAVAVEQTRVSAAVIVAGVAIALLLIVGVVWSLLPSADEDSPQPRVDQGAQLASKAAKQGEPPPKPEAVDEIVIEGEQSEPEPEPSVGGLRPSAGDETGGSDAAEAEPEPETDVEVETAPVWFESQRSIGTCQISYDGHTRTANLHVKTRAPEGKLEFSYRCGEHRGRGSIDIKRNRVNGVLFCNKGGAVKVKTVRSNEGRCDR